MLFHVPIFPEDEEDAANPAGLVRSVYPPHLPRLVLALLYDLQILSANLLPIFFSDGVFSGDVFQLAHFSNFSIHGYGSRESLRS